MKPLVFPTALLLTNYTWQLWIYTLAPPPSIFNLPTRPRSFPTPKHTENHASCPIIKQLFSFSFSSDGMTQADVGLTPNMPFFSSERAPTITYLHLHECDKFSIGIFCLPPTSVIPLHNHPEMTVFSKLLFGTMHIKAYDWLTEAKNDMPPLETSAQPLGERDGLRLAKVKFNSEFTAPCGTSILYPADGGNMHCFTAKTACAVLDVLGPPYSDPDGRHCQYYYDFPITNFPGGELSKDDEEYAWLKERENPEDLSVVGAPYNGPKISNK